MTNPRRVAGWLFGTMALFTAALPACSSDDDSTPPTGDAGGGADGPREGARDAAPDLGAGDVRTDATADALGTGADTAPDAVPDSGPPVLAAPDFPSALAKAYCATVGPCCPGGTTGCEAALIATVQGFFAQGAANQVYSPVHAAACVSAVAGLVGQARCATDFAVTQPALRECSAALDGAVEPGGACDGVADCRHGTFNGTTEHGFVGCAPYGGNATKRCRAFAPTTTPGTACEMGFGGTAATVNVCAPSTVACVNAQCVALPQKNQPCPDNRCAAGSQCVNGTCVAWASNGQSCTTINCANDLSCNDQQTCEPLPPVPWILDIGFYSTMYTCPAP